MSAPLSGDNESHKTQSPGTPASADTIGQEAAADARIVALYHQSTIGLCELAADGRVLSANQAFCGILGRDYKTVLQSNIIDLTYEADREVALAGIEQLLKGGESITIDKRYLRPDVTYIWANSTLSLVTGDGRHRKPYILATVIDITARVKAQQDKYFLAAIVESSQDSIISIDFDKNITSWNGAAETLYGYPAAEAIGKKLTMLTLPEDLQEVLANVDSVKNDREVKIFDTVRMHKGGHELQLEVMMSPIRDGAGEVIGISTIARDITERLLVADALRESRERLRVTLESATDYAIITLDINGFINSWSKGAEMIFGYTETEILGAYADIIFVPEDRAAGAPEKEINTARNEGKALDERWHIRKNGSRLYMSGVMRPLISNGQLIGYVKVARDATANKLREQQKDDFIGIASHELKTPATSIKSYVELLHETLSSVGDTENVGLTEKLGIQVDRMTELIHTLLDVSRITEGKLAMNPRSVDLRSLVHTQVEQLKLLHASRRFEIESDENVLVLADSERIRQVLSNLLLNAVKYSPDDKKIIVRIETGAKFVKLSVQDFGIGISAENRERVFSRFFRESKSAVNSFPGIGLGLYIAAQIIELHGGNIGVDSEPGNGSIFYFTLPAAKAQ